MKKKIIHKELLQTQKWNNDTLRKEGFDDPDVIQLLVLKTLLEIRELLDKQKQIKELLE